MQRRAFITLVGGAIAWPLAARGQSAGKLATIGFLFADAAIFTPWIAAFVERLNALGWIEGRTVAFEHRWSNGPARDAEIAAEFVRLPVDVILTDGPSVPIVKQATSTIPIVFALASDPVGGGLVASLAHPGGNVTGLSLQSTDLAGKRIELLREAVSLWRQFPRPVPPLGGSGRQNPARRQSGRFASRAAGEIRSRHQSQDRAGHRYFYSRGAAGPCRRGHRIEDIFVAARESRRGGEDYGNRFCVLRCYYLLYPYEHCRRSRGLKSMGDTPWPTAEGSCCIRD